ncbi:MAG TPA: O-antigen ligase family protein [Solirubrobacterales bacterium]|nr:O-antigen ligase family protein [Solirubrobacterales bacterium]
MLSDVLAGIGLVAAASASAAAILLPPGRVRGAAMVLAMILFPVLIAGDQWHTTQIVDLRHDEGRIVALLAVAAIVIGALTYVFRRWPILMPLAIIVALPFRVPLEAGGDTANLLVPLYLVIAAAVLATLLRDWNDPPTVHSPRALAWILAAAVVLYALQTLYSEDFSKGLQNVCFFFIPFTVAYRLLREVEWDRRLLTWALILLGAEASAFVLIGTVELATRSLFWNDQIIRSNEFHTYFRVNSVFWDPNVYGRYLALVAVLATGAMLWARTRSNFWWLTGLLGVLWFGLLTTYSQSSFLALLAGLAMLAAIRWSWRWTLVAVAVGTVGAALVILFAGGSGKVTSDRLNVDLSGRGSLVSGGLDLFSDRPLWGYGSGSFQAAYRDNRENKDAPVIVSHTEPVTVAAEQGLIGLLVYFALIVVALRTLGGGLFGGRTDVARAALLAAFVALLVHTLSYAGFFEDPITWVLLAVGASLAWAEAPAVRDPA